MKDNHMEYEIEVEYKGDYWLVEAKVTDYGKAEYHSPAWDDPGGWEILIDPEFDMVFYPPHDEGLEQPEDNPDDALVVKAEAILKEIYWDRQFNL